MSQSQELELRIKSAVNEFAYSINSKSKVVADMSGLIEATSVLSPSNFSYWERLIREEFSTAQRESAQPKWNIWSKHNELLTWLDLTSWDGFKREQTLRTLCGSAPNAFFFSLAIRRLNDWVPQVRKAARETIPEIAKATDPKHVVDALSIALSNWNSWGRIEEVDREVFLQIISDEKIAESFKSKLISSTSGPMPSLFSQLGRTPILDTHIEELARLAIQPSVRAKAYRSLFEERISWVEGFKWEWIDKRYGHKKLVPVVAGRKLAVQTPLVNLLESAANDRSSFVRRISAEILIRELPSLGSVALSFAEKFASDKSEAVSERGKFALKRLEEIKADSTSHIL